MFQYIHLFRAVINSTVYWFCWINEKNLTSFAKAPAFFIKSVMIWFSEPSFALTAINTPPPTHPHTHTHTVSFLKIFWKLHHAAFVATQVLLVAGSADLSHSLQITYPVAKKPDSCHRQRSPRAAWGCTVVAEESPAGSNPHTTGTGWRSGKAGVATIGGGCGLLPKPAAV